MRFFESQFVTGRQTFISTALALTLLFSEGYSQTTLPNDTVARDMATFHQWSLNTYQDLQTEWDESSWWSKFKAHAVGVLPLISWYRQAQALDRPSHFPENWGMGETIADNVQNVMARPIDDRIATAKKAIKYLKENGNLLDAMTLAQALITFSTSDRFWANAVSLFQIGILPLIGVLGFRQTKRSGTR